MTEPSEISENDGLANIAGGRECPGCAEHVSVISRYCSHCGTQLRDDEADDDREWPDYTPLQRVVVEADGMLTLDFPARVGARPFCTFEDGEWHGVSVGPFDNTEDGKTVITTKELDVDAAQVQEMLEGARVVQLRSTQDTPLDGYDDWVYHGVGGPVGAVVDGEIRDGFRRYEIQKSERANGTEAAQVEKIKRMHRFDSGYEDRGPSIPLTERLNPTDAHAVIALLDDWIENEVEAQGGDA